MNARPRPPAPARRAWSLALVASLALAVSGCGAGYGDPITGGTDTGQASAQPAAPAGGAPATTGTTPTPASSREGGSPSDAAGGSGASGTSGADGTTTGRPGGGGSGGIAAYARAANAYCTTYTAAARTFAGAAGNLASGGTGRANLRRGGAAVVAFGDAVSRGLALLRAAAPPAELRRYHRATMRIASRATAAIDRDRSRLAAGDVAALGRVGGVVKSLKSSRVPAPAALTRRAPACKGL